MLETTSLYAIVKFGRKIKIMHKRPSTGEHRLTFKHSGKIGDIIYSLPAIQALGGGILYIGQKKLGENIRARYRSPSIPMSPDVIADVVDFLLGVSFLDEVKIHEDDCDLAFDFDLDLVRNRPRKSQHLARWYLRTCGVTADLTRPWLPDITPHPIAEIVVQHSMRYFDRRRPFNWSCLEPYATRCVFIGFASEHEEFCQYVGFRLPLWKPPSLRAFTNMAAITVSKKACFCTASCTNLVSLCLLSNACVPLKSSLPFAAELAI